MGAAVDIDLRYHDMRAVKARFSRYLSGIWPRVLVAFAVLCVLIGIGSVAIGESVGWLIFGLAAIPTMILEWLQGELADLAPTAPAARITDVLDGAVLGALPKTPTAQDIVRAIGLTREANFFAARFGISPALLQNITDHAQLSVESVWKDAIAIREQLGHPLISPGIIIVALLKQFPDHETLLAKLNVQRADVIEGIRWYEHLRELIKSHSTKRRNGGIARDWSFGYIPTLSRFGQNISEQISRGGLLHVELEGHTKALDQIISSFGNNGSQAIALVGKEGVGKSTLVHALAETLLDADAAIPTKLKFQQIFMLDAVSLLSAAPGRGQLEDLLMAVLGEAYAAKNVIVFLDNAQLFFEEAPGSVDITNTLVPIFEAGKLRVILAMDEQRYLQISRRTPAVANAVTRINVQPANEKETIRVLQDTLIGIEFSRNVTYTYQALTEAYRLSERYIHDQAMPGRAQTLLEAAAGFSENGLVTINSVQTAIEETLDVKVSVASESDERETLLHLEERIHQRMINQTRAVGVVSDALRRARAGVRNQDRPIGTFLFLGPTGVGKTELAKALADVYFGGEDRLVRLDLNEYVQSSDVARIIADGSVDAASLTAQLMKQPFSVVLLDEIEKAHPSVLTTLLQLLDEGILRDERNREVSFRDAIIIATSNAGAERIRELVKRGQKPEQFEQQFLDELIANGQFKPEFLNRFDEIVTFTPLSKRDLLQVVDLMIAAVNTTLEPQHVEVVVEEAAKMALVENGYDPRLGARPMRRVVQKAVENTVAKVMLSGQAAAGSTVTISKESVESILGTAREAREISDDATAVSK